MEEIEVSVICLAYNHEKYIRKCLDGFVNQKTNFRYEVVINDDCSTDNTANIIREYETKYPDIIKPIYQTENQYSKNVRITRDIVLPRVTTKYIAFCEGDDYWCDENKLQIQYDYMESHADCYCCAHSYLINNAHDNSTTTIVRSEEDRDFSLKEIVEGGGGLFSTNSLFMKTEVRKEMPDCFRAKLFGDYQMPIYAAICGKVHYINRVMSAYNYMIPGSWSSVNQTNRDKTLLFTKEIINVLSNIDKYYDYKYKECFETEIAKNLCRQLYLENNFKLLKKQEYYKKNKKRFTFKERIVIMVGGIMPGLIKALKH